MPNTYFERPIVVSTQQNRTFRAQYQPNGNVWHLRAPPGSLISDALGPNAALLSVPLHLHAEGVARNDEVPPARAVVLAVGLLVQRRLRFLDDRRRRNLETCPCSG